MDFKIIYDHLVVKNLITLRKVGKTVNPPIYMAGLFVVSIIIPLLMKMLMGLTNKTTFIFMLIYLGAYLSIPSIIYESKIEKFEKNIPKALYVMTLSLNSGRSITEAMEEVIKSRIEGVDIEFMKVLYLITEKKYSFEDAMTIVSSNSDSPIFRQMGRLIVENRRYGGNLGEVLKTLAKTLEDLNNLKQQLISTTANGLVVGLVIICGVIPATAGLIGGYLTVIANLTPSMQPPTPDQIAKCLELIQQGTGLFGLLFAVPLFGLKLNRMIITCAICMTGGVGVFYGIMLGSGYLFS